VRGHFHVRNKSKFRDRSKSKGTSKSLGQFISKFWKCGNNMNMKENCRSKSINESNGFNNSLSMEENTSTKMGDVLFTSTSTHSNRDVWLIESSASFHMTLPGEFFCDKKSMEAMPS
jgi:hypothetical protein